MLPLQARSASKQSGSANDKKLPDVKNLKTCAQREVFLELRCGGQYPNIASCWHFSWTYCPAGSTAFVTDSTVIPASIKESFLLMFPGPTFYCASPKNALSMQSVLDEMGAEAGSSTVNPQGEFVVARPEAIYLYTAEGRGPCFVFDGNVIHHKDC